MSRQGAKQSHGKPFTGFEPSEELKTTHTVNIYSQEKLRLQTMLPKPLHTVMQTTEPTNRKGAGLSWPQ